jgi:hypothetical protein
VIVRVRVDWPTEFETTRLIVNPPWAWYMCVGFWRVEVDDTPAPSPKFHEYVSGQPSVVVDRSVNWKTVTFFLPVMGEKTKSAVGSKQAGVGVGDGVGEGVGVGVGVGPAVPVGVGEGVGVGVGVAVAVGTGLGVTLVMFGRMASIADALWLNVMLVPPVNADRIGVRSVKCPTTLTVTWLPSASAQGDGLQLSDTSEGETVRLEPVDSVMTAHITRFVEMSHACPATNEVGWFAASRAPARAALSMETCDWKRRARSAAAAKSTRTTGMIRASSTIA